MFFNFRQPAPTVQTNVINLLAYPLGKLMAFSLPIATWRLPRWMGGNEISLNPGPWNIKEHALVFMMANVASMAPYAINAVVVAEIDYGKNLSYWFSVVLVMATQLTGFGLAGLCRRVLVWPASMVWPQNLVTCTVLNTLHAEEDEDRGGITRYKYFMYVVIGSFFFWFLPGAWRSINHGWIVGTDVPCRVPLHGDVGLFVGMLDPTQQHSHKSGLRCCDRHGSELDHV